MSYNSMLFVAFGAAMVLMTYIRFRVVLAEGMYEHYQGRLQKIERAELPGQYWARIVLMLTNAGAGLMMITHGTSILHL
ncbi:MAG TPA: hypothetical protein VKS60_09495 [Stellaceae bacterium]|nr:hypothetical protein [Stellaceae bacterium]